MKQRITYLTITNLILLTGIIIVLNFSHVHFLRHFIGDVLVVIVIYTFIKSFFPKINPIKLGISVFVFSCFIEVLQLFKLHQHLGLKAKSIFVALTLGTTFDLLDILAYAIGCSAIIILDYHFIYIKKPA